MPIVDNKLKLTPNAATFEGIVNALYSHSSTGTKFFRDDFTWDTVPKQFQSVVTVAKTGHADFVCSDAAYTSDDQCIQAALDYIAGVGGGEIILGEGTYTCIAYLKYEASDLIIRGHGGKTILDFTSLPIGSLSILIQGKITSTTSILSANAIKGNLTITVADGTKFLSGDWIRIRSEAVWRSWDNAGTLEGQTVGEIQQIASINGNIITLKEYLNGSYATSDTAAVDLVTMRENITIENFKMVGAPAVSNIGIYIKNAANVVIDHVVTEDLYYGAIFLYNVVGASITRNIIKRSNKNGVGYGLAVLNCSRDISGISNHFYDCRHGIMCGGEYYYGVQYNQTYIGNTMAYNSQNAGMFGPHPTYDGFIAIGNACIGCSFGYISGPNNLIIGNNIDSKTATGLLVEECTENSIISNNTIKVASNFGIAVRTGAGYKNIDITNNQITCLGVNSGISVAHQFNNLNIQNNTIHSADAGIVLITENGTVTSNTVFIKNNRIYIQGARSGVILASRDQNISNVDICGNYIETTSDPGIAIHCTTATMSKINVNNNNITAPSQAIDIYSTSSTEMSNVVVSNNECYGCGVVVDDINSIVVENNHIYGAATAVSVNANCTDRRIINNYGFNPVGNLTAPTLPASTVAYTNSYGYPCRVTVSGGTVTNITLDGIATGLTSGSFVIPVGGTIAITYSSAPTWKWRGL